MHLVPDIKDELLAIGLAMAEASPSRVIVMRAVTEIESLRRRASGMREECADPDELLIELCERGRFDQAGH